MSKIQIPKGLFDILPSEADEKAAWKQSSLWSWVEDQVRETARCYSFREIRTPIFERTELFARGVGETSDIVSKEMYSFQDRGGRHVTLRPEGTAPVMRTFIERHLDQQASLHKFFYIGPMFRYERPQAGRYRQHHQFGVEAIGIGHPGQDVECIDLLFTTYQKLGLRNLSVYLNSIGDVDSRKKYRQALQDYFYPLKEALSKDSQDRLDSNPLRILDSKDPLDQRFLGDCPNILEYLNSESRDHFEEVKTLLTGLKIPFEINPRLVRGLDYYNRTVFEIVSGELGAQNSIGGGGRYDGLLRSLGGPDLPAIGFGTGIERIIQTLLNQNVPVPQPPKPLLYFIPLGEKALQLCVGWAHELRSLGLDIQVDFSQKKVKQAMKTANSQMALHVSVVGSDEVESGELRIKNMDQGTEVTLPLGELAQYLQQLSQTGKGT